jgi:hypothetical protein
MVVTVHPDDLELSNATLVGPVTVTMTSLTALLVNGEVVSAQEMDGKLEFS